MVWLIILVTVAVWPWLVVSRAPTQLLALGVTSSPSTQRNDTVAGSGAAVSMQTLKESEEMMVPEAGEVIYNTSRAEESSVSQHRKKTLPKKMIVSFVNGIYHTEAEWREICDELKGVFKNEIRAFYNPSSGWWMKDALGAGRELIMRPNDLLAAKKLAEHLRMALREVAPNGRVLHLAHSGGAILTYLAAKYHLSVAETDRIDVATFGGGRSITRKYFKGRIVNYYARNDPLVILDRRAGTLVKRVPLGVDDLSPAGASPPCEVRDLKHNTTFVFLRGIANNPVYDHAMTGPTYLRALNMEARDFHRRLADLKATEIKEAGLVRKLRKTASEATGIHHFWSNVLVDADLALRAVRKSSAAATGFHGVFSGKHRKGKKRPIIVPEIGEEDEGGSILGVSGDGMAAQGQGSPVEVDAATMSLSVDVQEAKDAGFVRESRRWIQTLPTLVGDLLLAASRWWMAPVLVKVSNGEPATAAAAPSSAQAEGEGEEEGTDAGAALSLPEEEKEMGMVVELHLPLEDPEADTVVKYETSSGWGLTLDPVKAMGEAVQWARGLLGGGLGVSDSESESQPAAQKTPLPAFQVVEAVAEEGTVVVPKQGGEEEEGEREGEAEDTVVLEMQKAVGADGKAPSGEGEEWSMIEDSADSEDSLPLSHEEESEGEVAVGNEEHNEPAPEPPAAAPLALEKEEYLDEI